MKVILSCNARLLVIRHGAVQQDCCHLPAARQVLFECQLSPCAHMDLHLTGNSDCLTSSFEQKAVGYGMAVICTSSSSNFR